MKYTPDELRAQVSKMHPAAYEGGTENPEWLLNVGKGAGMLDAAADRIEQLGTMNADPWQFDPQYRCWDLKVGDAWISLAPRPYSCDRGRWHATVTGVRNIDGADAFPRYYMSLERAKLELSEWLAWRLQCEAQRAAQEQGPA